jgi:predicted dehydrogenase
MNVGVIGIGYWGKKVVGEYIDLAREGVIDGVGICDVRAEVLDGYRENIVAKETDVNAFLENETIDAVHICVNNKEHYPVAKKALTEGTHVLIEKPMTVDARTAYDLVELSAQTGLILQVGHIFRFANVIRKAKELASSGYFGEIRYLTLKWTTLMPSPPGVDIIWDLLPHPLDMLHFLTGAWPTSWQTMVRAYTRDRPSEATFINLAYDDFMANIELSWVTPERKRLLGIIGSERSAKIECVRQMMHVFEGNTNQLDLPVEGNNTIREEAVNFIDSVKTGKMMFNSHIIGAKNVDIIEKVMADI